MMLKMSFSAPIGGDIDLGSYTYAPGLLMVSRTADQEPMTAPALSLQVDPATVESLHADIRKKFRGLARYQRGHVYRIHKVVYTLTHEDPVAPVESIGLYLAAEVHFSCRKLTTKL
jgi:hypothetical protein